MNIISGVILYFLTGLAFIVMVYVFGKEQLLSWKIKQTTNNSRAERTTVKWVIFYMVPPTMFLRDTVL